MRTLIAAAVLSLFLAAFCSPLAPQSVRPIYLFSLEDSGVDHGPLHVFSVNSSSGALSEVSGSPFSVGLSPCCIAVDPTGRFVYVANSNSNDINAYSVSASTGTLTPLPGSPYLTGADPVTMAIDPTGRFLYVYAFTVANGEMQSSNVYAYSIDSATGVLTALPGWPTPQANIITSITFDPNGNYAFLAQTLTDPLALLIDAFDFANGSLTTSGSFFNSKDPIYLTTIDPSGKFLYATDPGAPTVGAFAFDSAQGSLSEIQGSPYPVGKQPFAIATDPAGKFLYVDNFNSSYQTTNPPSTYDGSISAFTIDPEGGALTPVTGSPFAAGINSRYVVVDPTGHFAYASSTTYTTGYLSYATILSYAINVSTGALTPLSGSPWMDSLQYSNGYLLAISYGPIGTPNPVPMISSISPPSVTAGSSGFTLQVNGVNFISGATVYFGGQARTTTFVNSTQLNANILSSDIANGGTGVVFVFNPLPGGGASTSIGFAVFNPSPSISSINPTSVVAGSAGFTLTVNGSSFVPGSVVNFNGTARSTTYVGQTQLTIAVSATDIANQGTVSITVTNPANGVAGGGTSDPVMLTILPASVQPVVGTLVPASATAGGLGFTLTVTGSGFTATSVVSFNLNNEPTAYVSSTQLTAMIPATAIAVAGDPVVIVTNPGVGISLLATFVVNNPPPGGGTVSPPSLPAGGAALTLNVTGTNFTPGSIVLVNGSSRVTTYVRSTLLQATLLPSDLLHGGTLNITVSNPAPGGGTTPAMSITVADYTVTAPTTPTSVIAGQPGTFALSVAPSNGTFSNPVTLTASGLPAGATASFSPSATITPGSAPINVTLSITTTAHSVAPPTDSPRGPGQGWPSLYLIATVLGVIAIGLCVSTTRVRRLAPGFFLALLLVMAAGLVACGGAGGGTSSSQQVNPATGTPAGTYSILVTATSGGVAHSTTVTLTVM